MTQVQIKLFKCHLSRLWDYVRLSVVHWGIFDVMSNLYSIL